MKQEDEDDGELLSPLPDGWSRVVDWSTGRAYYFNKKTRRSQWEKPWQGMMSSDDFSLVRSVCSSVAHSILTNTNARTQVREEMRRDPSPWQCTRCTFINEPGGIMCNMCHNMRPLKPVDHDKSTDMWECAACTYMNPSTNLQCAICFGMERRKREKKEEEEERGGEGGERNWSRDEIIIFGRSVDMYAL